MGKILLTVGSIILALLSVSVASAESVRSQVAQGNQLYQQGKYDDALRQYRAAQLDAPEMSETIFNMGSAYYKKKEYDKAIENFSQALATQNPKLESLANYNIGNCKYQIGEGKALSDLNQAVADYREALDYYKRAIELDPQNLDAKFNHELIERKIKELLSKQKEQQDKQKGDKKDQKDQKQDKKDKQEQSQQDEPKKKDEEQKQQAAKPDEKKKDQEGEKQPAQKVNISKDEAERLLRKLMDEQRIRRQNNQKPQGTTSNDVDKDW